MKKKILLAVLFLFGLAPFSGYSSSYSAVEPYTQTLTKMENSARQYLQRIRQLQGDARRAAREIRRLKNKSRELDREIAFINDRGRPMQHHDRRNYNDGR